VKIDRDILTGELGRRGIKVSGYTITGTDSRTTIPFAEEKNMLYAE
jgi:hypothetical protein